MKRGYLSLMMAASVLVGAGAKNYTDYVDPFIGTGGHGHVFLGANVPFGLVQLGPSQAVKGWDWCSGYHYSDSTLLGFSHTHLSGTGIGDLGDLLITPSGKRDFSEMKFSHANEVCKPGYYKVSLPERGMEVELTATEHAGIHRYTATSSKDSLYVKVNLRYGIGWDAMQQSGIKRLNSTTLTGYRFSKGWAEKQKFYFAAEFSRPMASYTANDSVAVCVFAPSSEPLLAKVGISPVSAANAMRNMCAEAKGWNFDGFRKDAEKKWNDNLGRIDIATQDDRVRRIFYTSLYHSLFAPMTFSDVNGDYRGADGKVREGSKTPIYTVFSLWDTYRAAHPLYSLIAPEMQPGLVNTFLNIYKEQGKLPVWHLHGNETNCMVGNPGAIVLADLFMKGYASDSTAVYDALKNTMMLDERSLGDLKRYGYLPYDGKIEGESVAKGMEYAIADDGVAKVARALGKMEDYEYFNNRSKSYKRYYDPQTGFMRGISKKGKFRKEAYSPFAATHRADDYCEGNGWQYLWLVPHDPKGLIELIGGKDKFVTKLDSLFVVEGNLGSDASPDISGLIGQYAHGNEPSHHTIYLYNYAGEPRKAAPLLRKVMNELYRDEPDGLCGNEDVGQMSAWYILSAMGLYQVEPVGGRFVIGSPVIDSATLNVGNGKTFRVVAEQNSPENIYVKSATLNGKELKEFVIDFKDIMKGGELRLVMGK